jgi:hypothetical protein
MAGNSVIGALRVVLGADSAALDKGLKDARGGLSSFAKDVSKIASGIGLEKFVENFARSVTDALKQGFVEADKLGKMAQSVGVPVEELSRLKHAADLSDVSLEALGKSMGKLSRNMVEVAGGAQNDVTQAFNALGISVRNTDGTLKSSSQVMTEIAGKFETYKDGAAKTALAIQLFGRAGADLIPLLNSGAGGLREMMAEADTLGIVIDTKTAKAAENFNDNLTRLGKVKDGIILKITAQLAPALAVLSERFIQAAKDGGVVEQASKGILNVMNYLAAEIAEVSIRLQGAAAEFKGLWDMVSAKTWDGVKKGFSDFLAAGDGVEDRVKAMRATIGTFWQDVANQAAAGAQETGKKIAAPVAVAASEVAKGVAAAERELQKLYAAARRTFEETRTPAEEFSLRIMEINRQFAAGGFSADTYARAVAQAQDRMVQANPVAQALGQSLTSAFDRAIQGGQKLSDVLKGLLQDLARAMANAAFKTLLFGNAGMGGGSAGILGSIFGGGAGMPMNILPGFASGGSFMVGGSGGIDSQIVAFRASPDERVTVSKNGQGNGMGGALTVRVSLDNALLRAVVVDESNNVVAQAAPSIINAATSNAVGAVGRTRRDSPGYLQPR